MAGLLFNEWNGIADDEYLSRKGEASDMNNIDISSPRKIIPTTAFGTLIETYGSSDTLNYVTETILDGIPTVVQSYGAATFVGAVNTTAYAPAASVHLSTGFSSVGGAWHVDTNPDKARHFFIGTSNIYVVNALGTALETAAISISSQSVVGSSRAICYNPQDGLILYARANKIYSIDSVTYTVTNTAVGQKVKLLSGAVIKYIYPYNNNIIVVSVLGNDTYIDTITQSGGTYTVSGYTTIVKGYKCIDAVGNNGIIYWISSEGIHMFSGQNQFIKKLQSSYVFSTSSRVAYNKGYLKIVDGTTLWTFGHTSPGFKDGLSKQDIDYSAYGVTENYAMVFRTGLNKWYVDAKQTGRYNLTNTWTSMPYMADEFGATKEGLWIRLGHRFPRTAYTDATVQCSIVFQVQTDQLNAVNSSTWVTVKTITDHTEIFTNITPSEISKALETAGYTSNFNWIKFKINLTGGDMTGSVYKKVPELFDFRINHNEILLAF